MKILGLKTTNNEVEKNSSWPSFQITNVDITGADNANGIWWNAKDTPVSLNADVSLPDGQVMIMIERVINGSVPVDDIRTIAVIEDGKILMNFVFELSGNYIIRTERLNEGLTRIDAGFYIEMDDIEFDVYI